MFTVFTITSCCLPSDHYTHKDHGSFLAAWARAKPLKTNYKKVDIKLIKDKISGFPLKIQSTMTVSPFFNKTMKSDLLSSYCQGGGSLISLDCWLLCMSLQEKKNTNLQKKMLFKDFNSPFTEEKKFYSVLLYLIFTSFTSRGSVNETGCIYCYFLYLINSASPWGIYIFPL